MIRKNGLPFAGLTFGKMQKKERKNLCCNDESTASKRKLTSHRASRISCYGGPVIMIIQMRKSRWARLKVTVKASNPTGTVKPCQCRMHWQCQEPGKKTSTRRKKKERKEPMARHCPASVPRTTGSPLAHVPQQSMTSRCHPGLKFTFMWSEVVSARA